MKNVIITGASGMIGGLILQHCLSNPEIAKVTSLVRKKSGITNPKLFELVIADFENYSSVNEYLMNQDIAYFCIGVYTGSVPRDEFRKITVDYTKAFASAVKEKSPHITFCFLSGAGADRTERKKLMFAKDKGVAENFLLSLQFEHLHIFRPSYIYPVHKRKEPNLMYRVMRQLYKPFLSWAVPNNVITSDELATVIFDVGLHGGDKTTYENRDIRKRREGAFKNSTSF